jgi:hypothetical protein
LASPMISPTCRAALSVRETAGRVVSIMRVV